MIAAHDDDGRGATARLADAASSKDAVDESASDKGKKVKSDKKKSVNLSESDALKAKVTALEAEVDRLKKFNADLQKANDKLTREAGVSETEQAKSVLAILSRVNSAKQWMKKVKDLDALLAVLAELKQFQATAPRCRIFVCLSRHSRSLAVCSAPFHPKKTSRVATTKHAQRMKDFDATLDKLQQQQAAANPNADAVAQLEQQVRVSEKRRQGARAR